MNRPTKIFVVSPQKKVYHPDLLGVSLKCCHVRAKTRENALRTFKRMYHTEGRIHRILGAHITFYPMNDPIVHGYHEIMEKVKKRRA